MAKLPVGKRPIVPTEPEVEPEPQATSAPQPGDDGVTWVMDDTTILNHCRDERRISIGFGEGDGGELIKRREKALNYYKGDVRQDIEDVDRRSAAVDNILAESIDTVMPDLIEIFLGGDDTVTFEPNGEEDEKQARSETDFINHVLFALNNGFVAFQSTFKDALLMTTGVFHWWWEHEEKPVFLPGQFPADLAAAVQQITMERLGVEVQPQQQTDDDYVTFQAMQLHGRVKYKAVPPEDFTVSQDTVILKDSPYCCLRERARVQTLIERGLPADKVENLPEYAKINEQIDRARDEAGEADRGVQGSFGPLRMVEIRTHFIRLDIDGDGKTEIVKVTTDFEEQELIDKEVVDHIPFSSLTPYMTSHRFYGESVADRLIEIMRIKTVLLRMLLDSGYFALNQRFEVAEDKASEYTLSDLLRNEPNMPVRSQTGDAVRPLSGGELSFNAFEALEYVSVMGEQRTGIMRNANGLNPDTLHDTAHGALALLGAAQKRVRFIARVFAETGVRDLALGIHRTLRVNWQPQMAPIKAKIGGSWANAAPHEWPERDTMKVQIGIGSGGREQELAVFGQQFELVDKIVQGQGGWQGPLVTTNNLYNLVQAWSRAAGQKGADRFWSDPGSPDMQKVAQAQANKPNPEMQKVQGDQQIAQAKLQNDVELGQARLQQEAQLATQKAQGDMQVRQAQAASDAQLEHAQAQADHQRTMAELEAKARADQLRMQHEQELAVMKHNSDVALAREKLAAEIQLQRERMGAELEIQREAARNRPQPQVGDDRI